jgi:hypothetical protein
VSVTNQDQCLRNEGRKVCLTQASLGAPTDSSLTVGNHAYLRYIMIYLNSLAGRSRICGIDVSGSAGVKGGGRRGGAHTSREDCLRTYGPEAESRSVEPVHPGALSTAHQREKHRTDTKRSSSQANPEPRLRQNSVRAASYHPSRHKITKQSQISAVAFCDSRNINVRGQGRRELSGAS